MAGPPSLILFSLDDAAASREHRSEAHHQARCAVSISRGNRLVSLRFCPRCIVDRTGRFLLACFAGGISFHIRSDGAVAVDWLTSAYVGCDCVHARPADLWLLCCRGAIVSYAMSKSSNQAMQRTAGRAAFSLR